MNTNAKLEDVRVVLNEAKERSRAYYICLDNLKFEIDTVCPYDSKGAKDIEVLSSKLALNMTKLADSCRALTDMGFTWAQIDILFVDCKAEV